MNANSVHAGRARSGGHQHVSPTTAYRPPPRQPATPKRRNYETKPNSRVDSEAWPAWLSARKPNSSAKHGRPARMPPKIASRS